MKGNIKLASACLLGIECRWDGRSKPCDKLIEMMKEGKLIPICPEQLSGFSTPRIPCEVVNGDGEGVAIGKNKVINKNGDDVTANFVKGAEQSLKIAKMVGATEFIGANKSPSCGKGMTYDGSFSGKLVKGNGVTAALFEKNGIKVTNVNDL